ncbi:MAG: UDP-2,3-diacylglucosamine diphosphatase LpxI [Pseudomonadota bacterium]
MTDFAVIAGAGALPGAVLSARRGILVRFRGMPVDGTADEVLDARFERLGALFSALKARGVRDLVFAWAMTRPLLDPTAFDAETLAVAPQVLRALEKGDDGLLRVIVALFEARGFRVLGAHEVAPDLTVAEGSLTRLRPSDADRRDAGRGQQILEAMAPLDIGQGCVVAGGMCLAVETLPGTNAMLRFVAQTRIAAGGVLIKRAKPRQDLRVDMPTIGPDTVAHAKDAGLNGVCIEAGRVIVLERARTSAAAEAAGIAIWGMA